VITATRVVKEFRVDGRAFRAVNDVSFRVDDTETVAIVGESGCGKTTLARMLAGRTRPDAGSITVGGHDLSTLRGRRRREMRRTVQLVPQDHSASLDPRWTVDRTLREAATEDRSTTEVLDSVGLGPEFGRRYPHELSSGQRQRVAIGRALAVAPETLVLDEPVAALDVSIRAQILTMLAAVTQGIATVLISHDLVSVRHSSARVDVMYLGRVVESGATDAVLDHPRHPYTEALLRAALPPDVSQARARLEAVVSGEPPSALDPPSGCPFRTRCPRAEAKCAEELPVLDNGAHPVACHFPS